MAPRKAFLLRLEPAVHDELQRWADAEMRSVNGQIEYLLRRALQQAGRLPKAKPAGDESHVEEQDESTDGGSGDRA
jgi:hypothetical protein